MYRLPKNTFGKSMINGRLPRWGTLCDYWFSHEHNGDIMSICHDKESALNIALNNQDKFVQWFNSDTPPNLLLHRKCHNTPTPISRHHMIFLMDDNACWPESLKPDLIIRLTTKWWEQSVFQLQAFVQ
jgi:hypothetical protein